MRIGKKSASEYKPDLEGSDVFPFSRQDKPGRKMNPVPRTVMPTIRILLIGLLFCMNHSRAEHTDDYRSAPPPTDTNRLLGTSQGELLPAYLLEPVEIHGRPRTEEEKRAYLRLVYNIRRTYPYAVLAKQRMDEYNAMRNSMEKKKEQRKYLKEQEDKIKEDFLEDLKNMTRSQGAILIKLLARQTGTTAYFLLKNFRGGARALAYQTMARFWGYNLKESYDPHGTDIDIETVVRMIEQGRLSTIPPKTTPALEKDRKMKKRRSK